MLNGTVFTPKAKINTWYSCMLHITQFWSGFVPVNRGGQIYPTLTAISPTPTFHITQFKVSFSKPTLLLSFSTSIFHVFFGSPQFLLPFTSNSFAFLKTMLFSKHVHHSIHFNPLTDTAPWSARKIWFSVKKSNLS